MALQEMYRAVSGSAPTQIRTAITAAAQTIEVEDASVLPAGPNLMTIGQEDGAEVIRYGVKDGNTLRECLRGFGGTMAMIWPQGTLCYRAYTAADHNAFLDNLRGLGAGVEALGASKQDAAGLAAGAFAEFGAGGGDIARGNHTHAEYIAKETDPTVPAWAKAAGKPGYTAAEVGAVPANRQVNGKGLGADITLSAQDVGAAAAAHAHAEYLAVETDPTVPAWAKAPDKPSYTAEELGVVAVVDGKADADRISSQLVTLTAGHSLGLSDSGKMLLIDSAAAVTVTVPAKAAVSFPIGAEIELRQQGPGLVTFAAAPGVALTSLNGKRRSIGQYAIFTLKNIGADSWALAGELEV